MEGSSESPAFESNTRDGKVQEAYKLANTITMGHLTRKLQADPTADLSSVLEQQARLYPELRGGLAEEARDAAAVATRDQDDQFSAAIEVGDSRNDDDVEISHPLCSEVVDFAGLEGQVTDDELVSALMPKLHQLMRPGGHVLFSLHDTSVLGLGEFGVVKIGSTSLNPEGITNLRYVNSRLPQIPSPKFLGSMESRQRIYVFMTRGKGATLEEVWPQLQVAEKRSVQEQLNEIFSALRATAPPDDSPPTMGGFVSGLCQDMRRWPRTCEGVFTEAEFNDFLCRHENARRTQTPWIKMVRSFMKEDHKLVMTHGDLHPRNIMVEWGQGGKDIKVTCILDWEMAGWYPEHWEFVKALTTADERGPLADWCDYLPTEAIGQWPTEFSIDLLISRWLG